MNITEHNWIIACVLCLPLLFCAVYLWLEGLPNRAITQARLEVLRLRHQRKQAHEREHNMDAMRLINKEDCCDEAGHDWMFHVYGFTFCPHCGKRIT